MFRRVWGVALVVTLVGLVGCCHCRKHRRCRVPCCEPAIPTAAFAPEFCESCAAPPGDYHPPAGYHPPISHYEPPLGTPPGGLQFGPPPAEMIAPPASPGTPMPVPPAPPVIPPLIRR